MKIKTIRFKKKTDFSSEQEKEIKNMIIIIALFAAGMIIGSGITQKGSSSQFVTDFASIFDIFTANRNDLKAYQVFFNTLTVNFVFLIALFCSGFSCIGIPAILTIPVIKGIGLGVMTGYLFSFYSMNGIGYYLLTIFPSGVISVSMILLASCSSGIMSKELLAIALEKKQPNLSASISYIKRYAVYIVGMVIASAVETVFVKAFSYLFVF